MTRSPKPSDGELLEGLPSPSMEDREALWRTRAPHRLSPEELASLLALLSPGDERALRERPVFSGEPFAL
jgi:hypothetical protein